MKVKFFFQNVPFALKDRKRLKEFIAYLFKMERVAASSLDYVFCNDAYLLSINEEFLKHHDYTDIITFSLAETSQPVVGEVYISIDRVKFNALKFHVTFQQEMHRVIFHGALHLCGYEDNSIDQKKMMRRAEDVYLAKYFKNVPRIT